jgi:hypothetical protein
MLILALGSFMGLIVQRHFQGEPMHDRAGPLRPATTRRCTRHSLRPVRLSANTDEYRQFRNRGECDDRNAPLSRALYGGRMSESSPTGVAKCRRRRAPDDHAFIQPCAAARRPILLKAFAHGIDGHDCPCLWITINCCAYIGFQFRYEWFQPHEAAV